MEIPNSEVLRTERGGMKKNEMAEILIDFTDVKRMHEEPRAHIRLSI
jgi:hypothetical protein